MQIFIKYKKTWQNLYKTNIKSIFEKKYAEFQVKYKNNY